MCHVGIDVGKSWLDIALVTADATPLPALPRRVANTDAGITQLVAVLTTAAPTVVVVEATGAYHRSLLVALLAAGVPTALVNPAQVAAFRTTGLGREKTDRADARLLARFAQVHGDQLRRAVPASPIQVRLKDLVAYRDGQVREQTRLTNRLHAAGFGGDAWVTARLQADLTQVAARLADVEAEIERLCAALPEARVLQTLPGVGLQVAAAVLGYLPAETWGNAKAAAAYAGVHPRREPSARAYYDRLIARGKPTKSARCAVMHQLLRRMMGTLRAFYAARDASGPALAA